MAKVRLPSQDSRRRFRCARDAAYTSELKDIPHLLYHLCRTITGPPPSASGPNPLPYRDRLYCIVLTEFFGQSIRRSEPLYELAQEKGYVSKAPSFNSVIDYYGSAEVRPLLQRLIGLSTAPFVPHETDIILDGTHFAMEEMLDFSDTYTANKADGRRYVMAHFAGGYRSRAITAAEVDVCLDKYFRLRHDSHFTELLLRRTAANGFRIEQVWADKGYHSGKNRRLIEAMGAEYMVTEKSGEKAVPPPIDPMGCDCPGCNKRNMIETINSMVKQIMGDKVFNKTPIALENEVLGRVVAHNLRALQQAMIAKGLEVDFDEIAEADRKKKAAEAQKRLPRTGGERKRPEIDGGKAD